MQILQATGGVAQTNCYLVADEVSGDCVLIDAPDHTVGPLLDEVEKRGWRLAALWITHGHFDHLADHAVVKKRFPKSHVVIHELDVPRLQKPGAAMFRLPFEIPPGEPTVTLVDGNEGTFGSLKALAMHTPGHCPGHLCYYFEKERKLFGGDLLFAGGGIGRLDFPGCSVADMQVSIQKVMQLPDEVEIFTGHGEATTIGEERATNPYVRRALAGTLAGVAGLG